MDADSKQLIEEVKKRIKKEVEKPFVVSVMGQTGVGKSSLINALFNTNLRTDPVRPCTKEIERVVVKGNKGTDLWFYDLPGIGESDGADAGYLADYKQKLLDSDVVLWAIHADNRSVSFDVDGLNRLLHSFEPPDRVRLMSKVTFILNKVDLITPTPWILVKVSEGGWGFFGEKSYGMLIPGDKTKAILREKERYYQEVFLLPYRNLIVSQTHHDGSFDVTEPPLYHDEFAAYYQGFMDVATLEALVEKYPRHKSVFLRLYDNYRVISCSARFKFNLTQLMLVVINKLGLEAVGRFDNFLAEDTLNRVGLNEAKEFCNLVIYDRQRNRIIFDLTRERI